MPKRKEVFKSASSPRPAKRAKSDDSDSAAYTPACNCKKTECLKSYCECFKRGMACSDQCKCQNCKNYPGSEHLKEVQERRSVKKPTRWKKKKDRDEDKKKGIEVVSQGGRRGAVHESIMRDAEKKERVEAVMQYVAGAQSDYANAIELGKHMLGEVRKEALTYADKVQKRISTESSEENDAGDVGNATTTAQGSMFARTPSTPTRQQNGTQNPAVDPTLSPDTLSLLCDETDAVQTASRPQIAGAPGATILQARELNAATAQKEAFQAVELKVVLHKKVLTTFRDHLAQIVNELQ